MATARRMSRASGMGVGIPLPDLLSTVPGPEEASVKERLEKMVNLVVNSTIRFSVMHKHWGFSYSRLCQPLKSFRQFLRGGWGFPKSILEKTQILFRSLHWFYVELRQVEAGVEEELVGLEEAVKEASKNILPCRLNVLVTKGWVFFETRKG